MGSGFTTERVGFGRGRVGCEGWWSRGRVGKEEEGEEDESKEEDEWEEFGGIAGDWQSAE